MARSIRMTAVLIMVAAVAVSGCAKKKRQMISFAEIEAVVRPSEEASPAVVLLPGQVWPPPVIR